LHNLLKKTYLVKVAKAFVYLASCFQLQIQPEIRFYQRIGMS